jgi:hypothetical protein
MRDLLVSNNLAYVHDAGTASAARLTAWEIMADNATGSYVSNVGFNGYRSAIGTDSIVDSWMNRLDMSIPAIEFWESRAGLQDSTQDFAGFELGNYLDDKLAVLLAGLGLMGFVAIRRSGRG